MVCLPEYIYIIFNITQHIFFSSQLTKKNEIKMDTSIYSHEYATHLLYDTLISGHVGQLLTDGNCLQ